MIESVTLNQQYFRVPTLRSDARGLVLGERGLLRFSILPQVVSFFQALTQEQSLDHISSSLRLVKIQSRQRGPEFLVDLPAYGSYLLDSAAGIARLLRGEAFTGSWPHFVPYRDRQSPFGYDASALGVWTDGPIFYGKRGDLNANLTGELSFESLLLDLSLERRKPPASQHCLLKVPIGLRGPVQSYLMRRHIKASVARVYREAKGRFDREELVTLFDVPELPERLYSLLEDMPGMEVYHQQAKGVYVERGWGHPFAVENCRRFFSDTHWTFFCGSGDRVDRIGADGVQFVSTDSLKAQRFRASVAPLIEQTQQLSGAPDQVFKGHAVHDALEYRVSIVRVPEAVAHNVVGMFLMEPKELLWLKRVVFNMPRTALADYQAAYTDQGVLLYNPKGIEWVPFGVPLYTVFPNVFMPLGSRFAPPIEEAHLAELVGAPPNSLVVFPAGIEHPVCIPKAFLRPVAKSLLADIDLSLAQDLSPATTPGAERGIELKSQPVGRLALWSQNLFKPTLTRPMKALPNKDQET